MKTIEYKLVWPRRDRAENQHQTFRTLVSLENKLKRLRLAGYKDIETFERDVEQGPWRTT